MTKTRLTGVDGWLEAVGPMTILPAMSENLTALPSVGWCGQLIFGHTGAAHVVFPNACPCVLIASRMETMKVSFSLLLS